MPSLPSDIQEHLESEFKYAASKVADSPDMSEKVYYFSVFFGQTGRVLNQHWDADLALLWSVGQHACQAIQSRMSQPGTFPVGGFTASFGEALDQVSGELAASFEGGEVDVPRLYAALARTSELIYATTGNGAYLAEKGLIKL